MNINELYDEYVDKPTEQNLSNLLTGVRKFTEKMFNTFWDREEIVSQVMEAVWKSVPNSTHPESQLLVLNAPFSAWVRSVGRHWVSKLNRERRNGPEYVGNIQDLEGLLYSRTCVNCGFIGKYDVKFSTIICISCEQPVNKKII